MMIYKVMGMIYLIQMILFIKIYALNIQQKMELIYFYQIEENIFLMIQKLHAKKDVNILNMIKKQKN